MQNRQLIPTHQIIAFVVFLSAALITSLFVFHLKNQSKTPTLDSKYGLIFPVARDINSFELVTTNNSDGHTPAKFTLENFYHHWTLLFFGFTHCASVCPSTLDTINRAYTTLHNQYPNLQVVLISVDPERDTPASLTQYTHSFNPAFIGAAGKIDVLRKLQSQLGVYAARETNANTNYQIEHTATILLINPQGKWAGLFNYGLKPLELAQAFSDSVNALSNEK